jgi:hypothetical protein
MNTETPRDALKAQLLDSIRMRELSAGHPLMEPAFEVRERELRAQIEALEYADNKPERTMTKIESEYKEMMEDVQMSGSMIAYCMTGKALELERELTAVTEQRDEIHKDFMCLAELLDGHDATECRMNLVRLKEQRDRLAEALKNIASGNYSWRTCVDKLAPEALQSLTTNEL